MKKTKKKAVKKVKKVVKKPAKKSAKKTVKKAKKVAKKAVKKAAKKSAKKVSVKKVSVDRPIGEVTHFYNHIGVAIVKFNRPVEVGTTVRFEGATTKFATTIASMQYDHKSIRVAPKGQQIGIKVPKRTREGDQVYLG